MADNFDMKKFLVENKLGSYARARVNEVDEAKSSVTKEQKIQVIKEWIWYTCDEGQVKDDINKYNKMVDMYFANKEDVTKEDFKKIWNKVTEKWGVGDVGADSEAFPETWRDVQTGNLVNPDQVYEGEAAYEYEKGKAAGEKIEKEKLKENVSLDTTKLKMFIKALVSLGGGKQDKQDYKDIANLLIQNKLADAAEMIRYMDTAPNEMIYSAMMRTYPDLWDTLFDNPPGDYIALAKPKAGLPEKKLAKEDMGHDIEDAEAMKQMDFLAEKVDQEKVQDMYDKITAVISKAAKKLSDDDASALHDKLKAFFNKLLEAKKPVEESIDMKSIQKAEMALQNLLRNISTSSNIPTDEKSGLINALGELQDFVDEVGFDSEVEQDEYASDYSKRRQSDLSEESVRMFKSDNPEGDKLVLNFLKRIAKDFNYPVQQAALFVKERIKKLGY